MSETCASCPIRTNCPDKEKIIRDSPHRMPGCCFGGWREQTGCSNGSSKCGVREMCEIVTKSDKRLAIMDEYDESMKFSAFRRVVRRTRDSMRAGNAVLVEEEF